MLIHWLNGSVTTAASSRKPSAVSTLSRSVAVVAGTMRSTMVDGQVHSRRTNVTQRGRVAVEVFAHQMRKLAAIVRKIVAGQQRQPTNPGSMALAESTGRDCTLPLCPPVKSSEPSGERHIAVLN